MKNYILTLTILSVTAIALIIEVYNAKAGFMLPNTRPGKWRVLGCPEKQIPSRYHLLNSIEGRSALTEQQKKEIEVKIKKAKAEATLRSLVRDFGLIQYPLSSILIIIGILGVLRGKEGSRKLFITSLAVGLIALSLALQRSYFTSLGW